MAVAPIGFGRSRCAASAVRPDGKITSVVTNGDPLVQLQAYIDERWAIAQPQFYPTASQPPQVHPELTCEEAEWFLAAVTANAGKKPVVRIDDERKMRSDRFPPRADGSPLAYLFFEEPGRLRLETIVHLAAVARLEQEFGWPREHIVMESPRVIDEDRRPLLHRDALDMLLLENSCPELRSKMSMGLIKTQVAVETKATPKLAEGLLQLMRTCRRSDHAEHEKCLALEVLRPRFFLVIAAGETWRLSTVVERDGRAVLGEELKHLRPVRFDDD